MSSSTPQARGKRGPELDCITRARICELHTTNGWGATRIKKERFPDIPRSTIQYTITQESKREKQESRGRTGRPKLLTEDERNHIYETLQRTPSIPIQELLKEINHKVNRSSIWRLTHEMGLRKGPKKQRSTSKPEAPAKSPA